MPQSQVAPDLHLIKLDQEIAGFSDFISAWLYHGHKTLLIDVGPAATVPKLVAALSKRGVTRLDAVLLTHIHIDHAGGVGDLLSHYPGTPVICHPKGMTHLKDPQRLWEGSLKTLGKTAEAYGAIKPVPEALLVDAFQLDDPLVTVIATPGHSPHHISFLIGACLFVGEAAGVYMDLETGFYMRPATPPRFFLETTADSIDALIKTPYQHLCFAHFGLCRHRSVLAKHKQQLFLWKALIAREMASGGNDVVDRCMAHLIAQDPLLKHWDRLSQAIQQREAYFFKNSIRGFMGYLQPA